MKISLQFDGYDEFTKYMGRFAEITHLLKGETGKATIQVQMPEEVSATPQAPVTPQVPVTPQAPVTPQVPTQMPTYSIDQIAVGAIQLKDAGRLGEFQQLLAKFGVAALTQLQPSQLPVIAAELQKMGVKL